MVPRAGPPPSHALLALLLALVAFAALAPSPAAALLSLLPDDATVDENNLPEGASLPLSLPEAAQLLRQLRLEGEGADDPSDARLIGVTDGGLYRGDLVVYLPITFLLPTFAFRSRYSLAGKKNSDWWGLLSFLGRSKEARARERGHGKPFDIRGPVDQVLTERVRYDPALQDYIVHEYGPLLSRVDAYFHYLRVHDDDCRLRAICQLAAHPAAFTPLSHLVLAPLKKSESVKRPRTYHPAVFRFFRYYWAAERGAAAARKEGDESAGRTEKWTGKRGKGVKGPAGSACRLAYPKCPADLEDIVNMRVLRFWQQVANYVSIKLSDE